MFLFANPNNNHQFGSVLMMQHNRRNWTQFSHVWTSLSPGLPFWCFWTFCYFLQLYLPGDNQAVEDFDEWEIGSLVEPEDELPVLRWLFLCSHLQAEDGERDHYHQEGPAHEVPVDYLKIMMIMKMMMIMMCTASSPSEWLGSSCICLGGLWSQQEEIFSDFWW